MAGPIESIADLPDPRIEGASVVLAMRAVMSGAEGWDDIEVWSRERQASLRCCLLLQSGIPGHDMIWRVFEAISPQVLEERFEGRMSTTGSALKGVSTASPYGGEPVRARLAGTASGLGLHSGIRADAGSTRLRIEIERDHGG